jgi:uncharacterized protein (DUF1330 family)
VTSQADSVGGSVERARVAEYSRNGTHLTVRSSSPDRSGPVCGSGIIGSMTAYVISEVEVLDETLGQRYRELAAESIARYGGRYIVRGAEPDVPEGDWPGAQRVVVVEFPSMDRLKDWYASAEYAEALAIRRTALTRRLLFVDGVAAGKQD